MKLLIQRIKSAKVYIGQKLHSETKSGLLVYVGISNFDINPKIDEVMIQKLLKQRIFEDENEKMNLSVEDVNGEIMIISNFTLYGDAQKGTRPSYTEAAKPEIALEIYNRFLTKLQQSTSLNIKSGEFQAMMEVHSINDGPVNLLIQKEIVS